MIAKLNEFPKLNDLYLFNFEYNEETLEIIDEIKGLISLSFSIKPQDELNDRRDIIPFKKPKNTIKKLYLNNLLLPFEGLISIGHL